MLSETEAVARAHVVRMAWGEEVLRGSLLVYLDDRTMREAKGDDARRVWREWITDMQTMADLLCDYERALKEIEAQIGRTDGDTNIICMEIGRIASEALAKAYKEPEEK